MNPRKHLIIPDSQVTQDTPTDHLRWIGNYIVEKQPDVILHIGDFADMESLSSYNVGKIQAEGTRYKRDLIASRNAMHDLLDPLEQYNEKRRLYKEKQYRPEMHLTLGNHENRITRYVENNPNMVGFMSVDDLEYESFGWKVHDFLKVVEIDGVAYSHYFYNPLSGRPYGGESIETRLKNLGFSFVQGHQQIYKVGTRCLNNGRRIRGLIQGSCLTPDHKVLTADLRYVELGSLSVGDKLISFDENVKGRLGRKYRTGSVDAIRRDVAECFAVTLDNGKVFKVTGDHLWLTRVGGQKSPR